MSISSRYGSSAESGVPGFSANPACRPAYLARLVAHYRAHLVRLPELERRRLETNPLRLLDSRDPAMAEGNEGGFAFYRRHNFYPRVTVLMHRPELAAKTEQ